MASRLKNSEKRFPKTAVDYIDALLEIQQTRFDQEKACENTKPYSSKSAHYFAEGDHFSGVGWSSLFHRRDGTGFRWMGRIGTLLLPLDLSSGGSLLIEGAAFSRHRHLKSLTVWIEDQPIQGSVSRRGLNRWHFTGTIPAIQWRPYSILRLQSAGASKPATGTDQYTSVAVSSVQVSPKA